MLDVLIEIDVWVLRFHVLIGIQIDNRRRDVRVVFWIRIANTIRSHLDNVPFLFQRLLYSSESRISEAEKSESRARADHLEHKKDLGSDVDIWMILRGMRAESI